MPISSESVKQIYSKDLQKRLFPKNGFVSQSKLDSGIAIDAETITIPQETLSIQAKKNPTSYPLTVTDGYNDKKAYKAELYYTDPFHIPDHHQDILNYDKRSSVLEQKSEALRTKFADDCAFNWSPTLASNIIRTTGSAAPTKLAGASGDRKAMTLFDFIEADRILTNMNVPEENRVVLLSGNLYAQLLTAGLKDFIGVDKLSKDLIERGIVGKILNFNIYKRSKAALYSNASTPAKKDLNTAISATTNEAAIFWHPNYVRRGEGTVKVRADIDKPEWLGSIANASFKGGSTLGRNDQVGVVSLVQAPTV